MTCSVALRRWRLRDPEYPWAASRTARRRFFEWTERFTRAMTVAPAVVGAGRRPARTGGVRLRASQQTLDVLLVAAGDLGTTPEATGALGGLLLEEVGAKRLPAPDLAGAGDLVALRRAPVGLHLGHWC